MLRWTERDRLDPAWAEGLLGPGALFELVEAEVRGHPVEVFAQRPRSVPEILERAAATHGERVYLIDGDARRAVTFADAPRQVAAIAAVLAGHHGVGSGDRVVLAGPVSIDHALTVWAVAALGAVAVTVNPNATEAELADAVELTRPVLIVSGTGFADLVARSRDEPDEAPVPGVAIDEDDPFAIVFTSGTTGRPKGATLSHRNAVHFSLAAAATSAVHSIVHELPASGGSGPCVIGSAPLFHVSGLLGQLTNGAFWGMTIVVPPPGRWDETTHLELSARHRVTSWSLVPTQLWRLIDHPRLADHDLSALEMVGGGGATFEPELLRLTAERLPHVAPSLRVGYGMTETAGTLTMLQPPVAPERLASVGSAVAGTEVEIRDAEGRPLPDGEIGEIWARGAQVFLGYWDDDEATAAALDARPVVRHRRLRTHPRRRPVPGEPAARPHHPGRREHLPHRDREPPDGAPGHRRGRGGGRGPSPPRSGGEGGVRASRRLRADRRGRATVGGAAPCPPQGAHHRRVPHGAAPHRHRQGAKERTHRLTEERAMTDDRVRLTIDGPIAVITNDNPEKRNAFNDDMDVQLFEILGELRDRPDVRAVIWRGEGHSFSSGRDVSAIGDQQGDLTHHELMTRGHRGIQQLFELDAPDHRGHAGLVDRRQRSSGRCCATSGWRPRTPGSCCRRSPTA